MTSTRVTDRRQDIDSQRAFISEVFHDLSQPLTALECSLDLALRRDRTLEQLRASIHAALQDAGRLRQRLILLRTLSDASDPGDLSGATDLTALLQELREDMFPLFDSAGKTLLLNLDGEPVLVRGNKAKLSRALFSLLEYLFLYSSAAASFSIQLRCKEKTHAQIDIAAGSCLPLASSSCPGETPPPYSCEIELARRSFRAAGGDLVAASGRPDHSLWRATLPLFRAAHSAAPLPSRPTIAKS